MQTGSTKTEMRGGVKRKRAGATRGGAGARVVTETEIDVAYVRLSTAYQLGMPDGRTGAYGCHVSDRHGLADTFRCVADARAA